MRRREGRFSRFLMIGLFVLCDAMLVSFGLFLILFYFYPGSDYGLAAFLVTMVFTLVAIALVSRLLWRQIQHLKTPAQQDRSGMYHKLRDMAVNLPPPANAEDDTPYCIVMDMGLDEAVVTLMCTAMGDASLYFSNGGGILGGVSDKEISDAAKRYVASSYYYFSLSDAGPSYPLPEPGQVHFFVLTKGSGFRTKAGLDELGTSENKYAPLFKSAQDIITELKRISELVETNGHAAR